MPEIPKYYQSPYYEQTQKPLLETGAGLLRGDVPDYYKPIGESGGTEFENMMRSIRGGISTSVDEDLARRNVGRGGLGASATAEAMGRVTPGLRYEDYSRAIKGRQGLLSAGVGMLTGVRGAGMEEAGARGRYDWNVYGAQVSEERERERREREEMTMWTDMISSGFGAAGTIAGAAYGGPAGAAAGGAAGRTLGSAVTSSPSVGMDDWTTRNIDWSQFR